MAITAVNTVTPKVNGRGYGFGASHIDNLGFAANTSVAYQYITAPADGVLKAVTVKGTVTSDATATKTFVVNNMSVTGDTAMVGTSVFTATTGAVLTADVARELTLAAAAALAVSKGDIIRVGYTGGTGSGLAGVCIEWELA